MSVVLGINAVFHDPAAALVVDGVPVVAAEEERFTRRKHGKPAVPFAAWELPEQAIAHCLRSAGLRGADLDAVAYAYDPALAPSDDDVTAERWEPLRTLYAARAERFLRTLLPDLRPGAVRHVPHHHAHAASAAVVGEPADGSALVLDGRGERSSMLAARIRDGRVEPLFEQRLPHSLGLLYEDLTEHLGFHRASDEYKVMALASYGEPRMLDQLRERVHPTAEGFATEPIDWEALAPAVREGDDWRPVHADLAASVQRCLEEVILALAGRLHRETGDARLLLAGGVALNCVANSRLHRESPFAEIRVQPAAGDAGTALGAAVLIARELGDRPAAMRTAALGRGFGDDALEEVLASAAVAHERPADLVEEVAEILADGGIVGWFQGRSEFGPRALGHRSLLADPRDAANLERLNDVKGREQFRPVAPMVLADRAAEIFSGGPLPSPHMLFVHDVAPAWRHRIPAVVHVDGTARVQTVDPEQEPLVAALLRAFERRTGVPVLVNTSFNTAGRPMVDHPREALECFGSAPLHALALGPFLLRRPAVARRATRPAEVAA